MLHAAHGDLTELFVVKQPYVAGPYFVSVRERK